MQASKVAWWRRTQVVKVSWLEEPFLFYERIQVVKVFWQVKPSSF